MSGLVALAIIFGGTATYDSIARSFAPATFHLAPESGRPARTVSVEIAGLTGYHEAWFGYVTGDRPGPPVSSDALLFTSDEYAHMVDVRRVFVAFRLAAAAAGILGLVLVTRAGGRRRRAALLLIRDAALAAAAGVALVAFGAAIAFDPLFLLFHKVFFPQGNFLFGPDSNLLAVYPDQYWYGVTLRIGVTFAVATGCIALAATATLRQARR